MITRQRRRPFAYVWFFPAASAYGALAVALWVWRIAASRAPLPGLSTPAGHAHEMLFGYALAVVAGFLLGPLPASRTLALLGAWVLARVTFLWWPGSWYATAAAAAFVGPLAAIVIPRFARSARKWRNRSVVVIVFGLAAVATVAPRLMAEPASAVSLQVLLTAVILLSALLFFMGGRIIAPAVAGYIVRGGGHLEARVQPALEGAGLVSLAAAAVAAGAAPGTGWAGVGLLGAAAMTATRLLRWRIWRCRKRLDLMILGLGYGWLAAGLAVLGVSIAAGAPAVTRGLHVLTIGALGTLTVAVMARTRLLARVRDANASPAAHVAALLMSGAALARVVPAQPGTTALVVSGACWCGAALLLTAVLMSRLRPS